MRSTPKSHTRSANKAAAVAIVGVAILLGALGVLRILPSTTSIAPPTSARAPSSEALPERASAQTVTQTSGHVRQHAGPETTAIPGTTISGWLDGQRVPTWCRHRATTDPVDGSRQVPVATHTVPPHIDVCALGAAGCLVQRVDLTKLVPGTENRIELIRAGSLRVTLRNSPPSLYEEFAVRAVARKEDGLIASDDWIGLVQLDVGSSIDVNADDFEIPLLTDEDGQVQVLVLPLAGAGPSSVLKAAYRYADPFVEIDAGSLRTATEGTDVHVLLQFPGDNPQGRLEISLQRADGSRTLASTVMTRAPHDVLVEAKFRRVPAGTCRVEVLNDAGASLSTDAFEVGGSTMTVSHTLVAASGIDVRVRGRVLRVEDHVGVWLEHESGRLVTPARSLTIDGQDTIVHLRELQAGRYRVQLSLQKDRTCTAMTAVELAVHDVQPVFLELVPSARFRMGDAVTGEVRDLELISADGTASIYGLPGARPRLYSCPAGSYRVRIGERTWQQELQPFSISVLQPPQ